MEILTGAHSAAPPFVTIEGEKDASGTGIRSVYVGGKHYIVVITTMDGRKIWITPNRRRDALGLSIVEKFGDEVLTRSEVELNGRRDFRTT